jgi:hypothetical protein
MLPGVFIALGWARLLSWGRSITFAILSYACFLGFVELMIWLEQNGAGQISRSLANTAGLLMFCAWSFVIYRIGHAACYWSPKVLRGWRRAGWFAVMAFCLSLFPVVLGVIVSYLRHV